MRIMVLNDPHVALTAPRGCKPVYTEDVFAMLEECRQYAVDRKVDVTVCTGDWFHSKMNVAHRLVRRSIEILKEWPGEKLFIAGNHDQGAEGLESLENQPLGSLFEAEVCEWLYEDLLLTDNNGVAVQFSPANWTDKLDTTSFGLERDPQADWAVKVSHGDLMPPRKDPYPWDVIPYDAVPTEGMDLLLNGHIHNNMGIKVVNDCTFANLGSIGRVARDDYNYQKSMEVLLVNLSATEMTFERLPLTSAVSPEELYYAKAGPDVGLDEPMARFAQSVERMLTVDEASVDEMLAAIASGVERPVVKAVKSHLKEAGWE